MEKIMWLHDNPHSMSLLALPAAVKYFVGFTSGFVLLLIGLYWFSISDGATNPMVGGLGLFMLGGGFVLWGELNRRRAAFP